MITGKFLFLFETTLYMSLLTVVSHLKMSGFALLKTLAFGAKYFTMKGKNVKKCILM